MARTLSVRHLLPLPLLTLAVLLVVTGCKTKDSGPATVPDVSAPPSVQETAEPVVRTVRLDEKQAGELNIETEVVTRRPLEYGIAIPGTVYPAPDRLALISAPISGRVVRIYRHEGEAVRRGQPLLDLESLEFASLVADMLQARADETYQSKQVERLELLVEKKISPRAALDKAQADLVRARAAVQASHARLHTLGVSEQQLEEMMRETSDQPLLRVYAPIDGVINEHDVDMGQAVTAYDQMMSLVNLDRVLVRGYVSPEDASLIRSGDAVRIEGKEQQGRRLDATVHSINPSLDETSKSVTVNILADTQRQWPRPGENVRVQLLVRSAEPVVMVPLSAIEYEGEQPTVFVRRDALTWEKRPITVRRMTEDHAVVAEGLEEGDEVAVSQIFSLKALGRYEQYAD